MTSRLKWILAATALIVLCLAYAVYWHIVAARLEPGLQDWSDMQREQGSVVEFEWSGIGGFPWRFEATFRKPRLILTLPDGGAFDWQGDDIMATMAPFNLKRIRLQSSGRHQLVWLRGLTEQRVEAIAESYRGEIELGQTGLMKTGKLKMDKGKLTAPDGRQFTADSVEIAITLPPTPPRDYREPMADIRVAVSNLTLPKDVVLLTGDPVIEGELAATIKGPMPPGTPILALAQWRDAGGVIEISRYRFRQDPLAVTGNGTLALDQALQPIGASTMEAEGLVPTLDLLAERGLISPQQLGMAKRGVIALERPGADGRKTAKFALSLQDNIVSLRMLAVAVPLFQVPYLYWQ